MKNMYEPTQDLILLHIEEWQNQHTQAQLSILERQIQVPFLCDRGWGCGIHFGDHHMDPAGKIESP
jgi:hypothetical protein